MALQITEFTEGGASFTQSAMMAALCILIGFIGGLAWGCLTWWKD